MVLALEWETEEILDDSKGDHPLDQFKRRELLALANNNENSADKFYQELILEPGPNSATKHTRLSEEGKKLAKSTFESFVEQNNAESFGFLDEESFDNYITSLENQYKSTPSSKRTAEQKYYYLSVRSLKMHKRRLENADVEAAVKSSVGPWSEINQQVRQYFDQIHHRNINQAFLANALQSTAVTVHQVCKEIAPDPLIQRKVEHHLLLKMSRNLSIDQSWKKVLADSNADNMHHALSMMTVSALGGDVPNLDQMSLDEVKPLLKKQISQSAKIAAIQVLALAHIDNALEPEMVVEPNFTNEQISKLMMEKHWERRNRSDDESETQDTEAKVSESEHRPGLFSRIKTTIKSVLSGKKIEQSGVVKQLTGLTDPLPELPFDPTHDQLSQEDIGLLQLANQLKYEGGKESPMIGAIGVDVTSKRVREELFSLKDAAFNITSLKEAIDKYIEFHQVIGWSTEEAVAQLFEFDWVTLEVEEIIEDLGFSRRELEFNRLVKKIGWRGRKGRRLLRKASRRAKHDLRSVDDLNKLQERRMAPWNPLRRLQRQIDNVLSIESQSDRSSAVEEIWAKKMATIFGIFRVALNLVPMTGDKWQIEQGFDVPAIDQNAFDGDSMVGVNTTGDGQLADSSIKLEDAWIYATPTADGKLVVFLDYDGDGIIDTRVPIEPSDLPGELPVATDQQNEVAPTELPPTELPPAESTAKSKAAQDSERYQPSEQLSSSETDLEDSNEQVENADPREEIDPSAWINAANQAIEEQNPEEEISSLEKLLEPVINAVQLGRVEHCTSDAETKDWCDTAMGEEGLKFPGLVFWLVGKDDSGIDGRGDAIHGIIFNAQTGKIIMVSLNRDIMVPGLNGDYAGPMSNVWWVDQQAYAEGITEFDPERAQRVLTEATGLPADIVMEVSWEGMFELVRFIYDTKPNEKIPYELEEAFRPGSAELYELINKETGEIPAGTIEVTPQQLLAIMRERKLDPEGTFGRESRQADFIVQILQMVLENPDQWYRIFTKFPGFLDKLEDPEVKGGVRTVSWLSENFDSNGDGQTQLSEFLRNFIKKVDPLQLIASIPQFSVILSDQLEGITRIAPSKTSEEVPLVNFIPPGEETGSKFYVDGGGGKEAVQSISTTTEDLVNYWEPLRRWVRDALNNGNK